MDPAAQQIQIDTEVRPVIIASALGNRGRFGNQILQYAFLRLLAKKWNSDVQTPSWDGQNIYGIADPPVSLFFPLHPMVVDGFRFGNLDFRDPKDPRNSDIFGTFPTHSKYLAGFKNDFLDIFTPVPRLIDPLERLWQDKVAQHCRGRIVGVHVRHGDYGSGAFFRTPPQWIHKLLEDLNFNSTQDRLFVASDNPTFAERHLRKFPYVTSDQIVSNQALKCPGYYPDHYFLSRCHVVAISNSSFSFTSAMVNSEGQRFFKPRLSLRGFREFDPWNSEIVEGTELVEDYPDLVDARTPLTEKVISKLSAILRAGSSFHNLLIFMSYKFSILNNFTFDFTSSAKLEKNSQVEFWRQILEVRLLLERGDFSSAAPKLIGLASTWRKCPEVHYLFASTLEKLGWTERAKQELELARGG